MTDYGISDIMRESNEADKKGDRFQWWVIATLRGSPKEIEKNEKYILTQTCVRLYNDKKEAHAGTWTP